MRGAREIRDELEEGFEYVALMHWDDDVYADDTDRLNAFLAEAPAHDAIFYQDHGGVSSWGSPLSNAGSPGELRETPGSGEPGVLDRPLPGGEQHRRGFSG